MKNINFFCFSTLLTLINPIAYAGEAFDSCPEKSFLVQGNPAQMFGINLSTGTYSLLAENMNAQGVLNALAFNLHDNYLYAWDKKDQTLVQIDRDFTIQPLQLQTPLNGHYYVGDISLQENAYYMYRKGGHELHGLWKISLDPSSPEYLNPIRLSDGLNTFLKIFDFAFHPQNGYLYSIEPTGELIKIDPADGSFTRLGDTGINGTFGAIYFDESGTLYASHNRHGKIYAVDPLAADITATPVVQGPFSANNDGARCGLAPVNLAERVLQDLGDAPDSYGTSIANNGARHQQHNNTLFFGSSVDAETQAAIWPLTDESVDENDEDGIVFVSTLTLGEQAIIQLDASAEGYANGWIDFNNNGIFNDDEQILRDIAVQQGRQYLTISVPSAAVDGITWSRFRIASQPGLGAIGNSDDGEVEDFRIEVNGQTITQQFYPAANRYVTLAFEDLWPSMGDYDMNDFVSHYRTSITTSNGEIIGIGISGQILAMGATFHNGLAVSLDGIPASWVDPNSISFEINGKPQNHSPLEAGHDDAVLVIAYDLWDYVSPAEGCTFYRTESNCGESPVQFSYQLELRFTQAIAESYVQNKLFNPFLFATPGFNRNSIFDSPPGRGLEIHLKNNAPTQLADTALLGRADDYSNPQQALYYQNANGLPWAMEIGTEWLHPREYEDLVDAYPAFVEYVRTRGQSQKNWYLPEKANTQHIYHD